MFFERSGNFACLTKDKGPINFKNKKLAYLIAVKRKQPVTLYIDHILYKMVRNYISESIIANI